MIRRIFNKLNWYWEGKHKRPSSLNDGVTKKTEYFNNRILSELQSNELILESLQQKAPFLLARFGSTELEYIYHYLRKKSFKDLNWQEYHRKEIIKQSGFFPTTDQMLDEFCELYLEDMKLIDVLGVWFKPGEDYIVRKHLKRKVKLIPLHAIDPYCHVNPWSQILEGKKVLVVHPFKESIEQQFQKRELLFDNPLILPKFELKVVKAVQSLVPEVSGFSSWFHALDFMKDEISKQDFDIAIIGAGAYGLPLAAHAKRMNKKVIHMGGSTQILFGIKGNRWDGIPEVKNLFNEYWIRPNKNEVPPSDDLLEDACYW